MRLGKFIAEKRKSLELTQNELAQQLGVKEKEVVKWEEKNVLPKNDLVRPLCEALGISANELVSEKALQEDEIKTAGEDNALRYVRAQNHLKFRKIFELILVAATLVSCIASVYVVCRVQVLSCHTSNVLILNSGGIYDLLQFIKYIKCKCRPCHCVNQFRGNCFV